MKFQISYIMDSTHEKKELDNSLNVPQLKRQEADLETRVKEL